MNSYTLNEGDGSYCTFLRVCFITLFCLSSRNIKYIWYKCTKSFRKLKWWHGYKQNLPATFIMSKGVITYPDLTCKTYAIKTNSNKSNHNYVITFSIISPLHAYLVQRMFTLTILIIWCKCRLKLLFMILFTCCIDLYTNFTWNDSMF